MEVDRLSTSYDGLDAISATLETPDIRIRGMDDETPNSVTPARTQPRGGRLVRACRTTLGAMTTTINATAGVTASKQQSSGDWW